MSKKPGLTAAFAIGEQPVLDVQNSTPTPNGKPTPTPKTRANVTKKDHRANRQAFTVWLDKKLIAQLRQLSRDLVTEHGRMGNSIETLVTEGIEHVLKTRRDEEA